MNSSKEGSSASSGDSKPTPPPRHEPTLTPVNGIVQPPVVPPPSRPGRQTNQLLFIKNTVIKAVIKHKMAWPFCKPVDSVKLGLPDYFKIIKKPMDLNTVQKRLNNNYYWCAKEATDDIEQVFKNCYIYNKPGEDVTVMSQTVEKFYQSKMKAMPPAEAELKGISSAASTPKAKAGGPGSAKKGPSPMSMSSSSGAEGTPTKGRFHSCGCNGLIIIR